MNLLLDTHVFLWWINASAMPQAVQSAISDPDNAVWLSAASAWEITIKASLGKLRLPGRAARFVEDQRLKNSFLGYTLVTADAAISQYPVKRLWG